MSEDKIEPEIIHTIKSIIQHEENLTADTKDALEDLVELVHTIAVHLGGAQKEIADIQQSLSDKEAHKRR